MGIQVTALDREYRYNGIKLPDPDPAMHPEAARDYYAMMYPELVKATVSEPKHEGDKVIYEFINAVRTKG